MENEIKDPGHFAFKNTIKNNLLLLFYFYKKN